MTKVQVEPQTDNGNSNTAFEPLLDPESSLMVFLAEPAISTISFFKGRDVDLEQSQKWLKERLTLICKSNPWLAGRLVKKKKLHKNLLLAIPQPPTESDVDALIGKDVLELSDLSTDTNYERICDKLLKSKMVVGPGYKLVDKELRCSKFSLAKVANGLALVVSITHAVSDGYTYYKIMSMLSGEIEQLCSTRKHSFVPKSLESIGKKEHKFLTSFSFTLSCIKSMMFGSKARVDAQYIDVEKVNELKLKNIHEFISTNDILTSSFARATRSDILMMAINLRKRVKEADEMDAGNYSLVVLHDSKSAATPSGIRQSLSESPFVRKGGVPLPGFFKTVNAKAAMITNWAFPDFNADLTLCNSDGEHNVPLSLHLPIPYHPKQIAFPIAVIFRPCKDKLGIIYGGSPGSVSRERMIEVGAPLGPQISNKMLVN